MVVQCQSARYDQWQPEYKKAAMPAATRKQLPALELGGEELLSATFGAASGGLLTDTGGSGGSRTSAGSSKGAGGSAGGSAPGGTMLTRAPGAAAMIV